MNVVVRTPSMTREQFLDWAERQEEKYEFDGCEPVAVTRPNRRHSRICVNLGAILLRLLDGSRFEPLSEAGVGTAGSAVRYPDVLVAPVGGSGADRLIADPIVVFEVVSPSSGRLDRTIKLREYATVASIRRYVIVDGPDLNVFAREAGGQAWTATALTAGETLEVPEVGIVLTVDELFQGVSFEENS